jgi:hypothetical protein
MLTFPRLDVHTSLSGGLGIVFAAALATASCSGAAQGGGGQKAPVSPDAQTAATRALETLRKLVTADNARDMGFAEPGEAASATLGNPVRVQMVRLDALRQYQAGADPASLLTEANRIIYPVMVRDQVKSSVIVEGSGSEWKPSSFGGPHLVGQLARYRTDVTGRPNVAADSLTVVHVAALNLYFLGYRMDGRLMLTPLENHPDYKLEAGSSLPADQVFAVLAPIARNYNGLPL